MVLSSVFLWSVLGISLILCTAFVNQYVEHPGRIVEFVLGSSLLVALGISSVLTLAAHRFAFPRLLEGMTAGLYQASDLSSDFSSIARSMRLGNVELHKASLGDAFSIRSRGRGTVAISPQLVESLPAEEVRAVLAHELSHLKNHDALAKGVARLARLAFPFDPVVRLAEAAVHRERELMADATAARHTRKPLALASALIHAQSIPRSSIPGPGAGLLFGGRWRGLLSLYPDLEKRIDLLLHMDHALTA